MTKTMDAVNVKKSPATCRVHAHHGIDEVHKKAKIIIVYDGGVGDALPDFVFSQEKKYMKLSVKVY